MFDADLTVPEGATLVVDTDARTALLNGATVSHHVDYALTDWPEIPGGPWQARFYPATDDGATLTIEWRSAWQ